MIYIFLPCPNQTQAESLGIELLERKLAACTKTFPVTSNFWWQGEIYADDEVVLMIESIMSKFDEIEKVVDRLHPHDAPVLAAIEVSKMSHRTNKWLDNELA